jgi:hypothetical protein
MIAKSQGTSLNPYDTYILECKQRQTSRVDSQGNAILGVEKHHIIPRFDNGPDTPENIVFLTVKEHVIAHWLRWKVLNKPQDYRAFLFRIGDTEEALAQRRESILEARERDRVNRTGFFSTEFQTEMGRRGGSIGGSSNTIEQFRARQAVGLTYGRPTGIGNQGPLLTQFISKFSIWAYSAKAAHEKRGAIRDDECFFLVSPKDAFVDITRALNNFVPYSITNSASMHKLVYGEPKRHQLYGWKIVNTLTRSEVREGIQEFIQKNPTAFLQYEESLMLSEGLE